MLCEISGCCRKACGRYAVFLHGSNHLGLIEFGNLINLRKTVGKSMGVKAAGGIRTLEDAMKMIEAGANRLGCSAGVSIVEALG